jgi:transcriptional regulator with XRE-family HTH domain
MPSRDPGRNPRQVFGSMVRYYRERREMSRSELARQICKSESLVRAIELGERAATADVTADLDTGLEADGVLVRLREEMGDGLGYQVYPAWFEDWRAKEGEAKSLRWYEVHVVPGLLQTEDYARAIFRTRFGITSDEVDQLVAARLRRQEILARDTPPAFWVILDESVLRRAIGGPQVMREQVGRLTEAARQPNIMIQIISASTGAHEGLAGSFTLADFEDAATAGHVECVVRGIPVEDAKDVALLNLTWDTLRGDALPRVASLTLLEEAAKSWTSTM